MPKVTTHHFRGKADSEEVIDFNSDIYVDSGGTFYARIPEQYEEGLIALGTVSHIGRGRSLTLRLSGSTLEELLYNVQHALDQYMISETRTEYVIIYDVESSCHYYVGQTGQIFANGYDAQNQEKTKNDDYCGWASTLNAEFQHFANHNSERDYSIKLKAEVVKKVIHQRGESFKNVTEHRPDDEEIGEYGNRLNSFVHVVMSKDKKEMPYTEDAARFFYTAMIALAIIADKITNFFQDDKQSVIDKINSGRLLNAHADKGYVPTSGSENK